MGEDDFWRIVDQARERGWKAADPAEGRIAALTEALSKMQPAEVVAFQVHFDAKMDAAYRWELWGAAYVLQGGCSDDGFTDFRSWLISLGQQRYEATLRDPDSLVDVEFGRDKEQDGQLEGYAYAAYKAHELLTGKPLPQSSRMRPAQPSGHKWGDEDLAALVPRLWAAANA